jgi:hypothetical protein
MQAEVKTERDAFPVKSTALEGSASPFVSVALLLVVPAPLPYPDAAKKPTRSPSDP